MMDEIRRFFAVANYCRKTQPGFFLFGILSNIADAVRPFVLLILSKVLIEGVLSKDDASSLFQRIFWLLFFYFALSLVVGYGNYRSQYHVKNFMRKHNFQKAMQLLHMDYEESEKDDIQKQLTSLQNMETKNVFGFRPFANYVYKCIGFSLGILVGLYFLRKIFFTGVSFEKISQWGWDLGFIVLFMTSFFLTLKVTAYINGKFAKSINKSMPMMRYIKSYNSIIYRYQTGKDIRLYHIFTMKKYARIYRKYLEDIHTFISDALMKSGMVEVLVQHLTLGSVFFFVAMKTLRQEISISEVLLYIGVFSQLTKYGMEVVDSISCLHAADTYRKELAAFWEMGRMKSEVRVDKKIKTSSPDFEFQNVSFSYPGSQREVLKEISLHISPGEKLAIVGVNGSGKSTLIKLLIGLYKNDCGKILVDGKALNELDDREIRDLFSPVFQDFKLISVTLRENVSAFCEISFDEVMNVLKKVGMEEFYLKHGLDVYLTRELEEDGIEISGGEAQKIAMARAMLKNSAVFILDEPTAALDPISEYQIYSRLDEMIQGKTTIFISHRLSSCKFCHRILVMDDGRIVQTGNHEELLSDKSGKYYELWQAQAQYYSSKNISSFERKEQI